MAVVPGTSPLHRLCRITPAEHTPGEAVPSGTVFDPEVKKRPPRDMVAEVSFP